MIKNLLISIKKNLERFYLSFVSFLLNLAMQHFAWDIKLSSFIYLNYTSYILMFLIEEKHGITLRKLLNIFLLNVLVFGMSYIFIVYAIAGIDKLDVIFGWQRPSFSFKESWFLFQVQNILVVEVGLVCALLVVFLWCGIFNSILCLDYNFMKAFKMLFRLLGKFPYEVFKVNLTVFFIGYGVLLFLSVLGDSIASIGLSSSFMDIAALFIGSCTALVILTFQTISINELTSRTEFTHRIIRRDVFQAARWGIILLVFLTCSSILLSFISLPSQKEPKPHIEKTKIGDLFHYLAPCAQYDIKKDYNSALKCYKKALLKFRDAASQQRIYTFLGDVHNEMGNYSTAVNVFKKSIALGANSSYIWYHLGISYYSLKDKGNAIKAWKRCVELGEDPYFHQCSKSLKEKLGIEYRKDNLKKQGKI